MVRQALPLVMTAAVLLALFGIVPGWGITVALPLAALSAVLLSLAGWNRQACWRWAVVGLSLWTVEELVWALVRFDKLPQTIWLTDSLYVGGVLAWFIALARMPSRNVPRRTLLAVAPVVGFLAWLLLQNWRLTLTLQFPIVETVLFMATLPLIEAVFRGRAHEGRLLWGFGFFIRALATALYAWLSPEWQGSQAFYLLSVLGYTFIGLGVWLELRNERGGLLPVAYTVIALEAVGGIVLGMVFRAEGAGAYRLGASTLILGYILFFGVMMHISADRTRRLRAEAELRAYSTLLEQLVGLASPSSESEAKTFLATLFTCLTTFSPTLTGMEVKGKTDRQIGMTEGQSLALIHEGTEVGQLYFTTLPKENPALSALLPLLASRIQGALFHADLRTYALSDPLTGLLNRRGLEEKSHELLTAAYRQLEPISVVMLDLDHFKRVNDHYGHDTGDEVLKLFATILQRNVRTHDLVARWGGEEFLLILLGSSVTDAQEVTRRIQTELGLAPSPVEWPLTLSAGIKESKVETETFSLIPLTLAADHALLKAKAEGRNRVEIAQ